MEAHPLPSAVEEALDELDRVAGWRALYLLRVDVNEAQALVDAMPWAAGGVARQGTVVRLFKRPQGLLVITGGKLSHGEGELLFDIHERVKDIAARAFIVPPQGAERASIDRMHRAALAPAAPDDRNLPNPRGWGVLATCMFAVGGVISRAARGSGSVGVFAMVAMCVLAGAVCAVVAWYRRGALDDILSDPLRAVATRWLMYVPR